MVGQGGGSTLVGPIGKRASWHCGFDAQSIVPRYVGLSTLIEGSARSTCELSSPSPLKYSKAKNFKGAMGTQVDGGSGKKSEVRSTQVGHTRIVRMMMQRSKGKKYAHLEDGGTRGGIHEEE